MNTLPRKNLSPDEITDVVLSFNDPALIANVFRHMGWTPSLEITETIKLAKQGNDLGVKLRAIKYLRELMRESAEAAGLIANISQTNPLPGGGNQTFHAKRIIAAMNPCKKIESTQIGEDKNVKQEEFNRESDRQKSRESSAGEINSERLKENSGGCKTGGDDKERGTADSLGGGADPTRDDRVGDPTTEYDGTDGGCIPRFPEDASETEDTPCSKTRKPDCNHDLFPGISGTSAG